MLEVRKSEKYLVATYDVEMIVGGGYTEREALENYIEQTKKVIEKTEKGLEKLKTYVVESEERINLLKD